MNDNEMQVIATIRTDFPTKFGIPRQSGIVDTLRAKSYLNRHTAIPMPCAAWRIFRMCG